MIDAATLQRIQTLEQFMASLKSHEHAQVGTFTAAYGGQTTFGVTTYTSQFGFYTRSNNKVDFLLNVAWTNATGTGNAIVGTLPFTSGATTGNNTTHAIWYFGVTYAAGTGLQTLLRPSNTFIEIWNSPASNVGSAQIAIEVAGEILITGTYFV